MNFQDERIKQMKSWSEDELLEIFILVEKNNFESKKEALVRYAKFKGVSVGWHFLHNELNQHYKEFIAAQI